MGLSPIGLSPIGLSPIGLSPTGLSPTGLSPTGLSPIVHAFAVVLREHREDPEATVIITARTVSGSVVTGALAIRLPAVITYRNVVVRDPTFASTSSPASSVTTCETHSVSPWAASSSPRKPATTAPGIPPDEQKQVLEHGYTTASGGTGIGPVTVRRIGNAHGWTVGVTDSDDGGARFEFRV